MYSSLTELVLHYAVNSLEEHNEKLRTTLMFPVGPSMRDLFGVTPEVSQFLLLASSPHDNTYIPHDGMTM